MPFNHKGIYAIADAAVHEAYGMKRLLTEIVMQSEIPVVQLRLKKMPRMEKGKLIKQALQLKQIRNYCLIINDDKELAGVPWVDGIHLGQGDLPLLNVKKSLPKKIFGLSTHSLEEALAARQYGADYIGCGSVFPTQSKKPIVPLKLEGLVEILKMAALPCVAIGGINKDNISPVAQTGCAMAAVMSGLTEDGRFVGQQLHEAFLARRGQAP